MSARTLYDKLWDSHVVETAADGTTLLYIDRHLIHEVTSPQAFEGLKLAGRKPWRTDSMVATADHNTPTTAWEKGIEDPTSRQQVETLDSNIRAVGALAYFPFKHPKQGIVHVVGPETGATLPGMTVVCGDSHTSTHGAFAALAHGIGTFIVVGGGSFHKSSSVQSSSEPLWGGNEIWMPSHSSSIHASAAAKICFIRRLCRFIMGMAYLLKAEHG